MTFAAEQAFTAMPVEGLFSNHEGHEEHEGKISFFHFFVNFVPFVVKSFSPARNGVRIGS